QGGVSVPSPQRGQPPAKIAATPGKSGSSEVFRTNLGKLPNPAEKSLIPIPTYVDPITVDVSGYGDNSNYNQSFARYHQSRWKAFVGEKVGLEDLTTILEDYNFKQNEATPTQGDNGETTYEHRDGRKVTIGIDGDDDFK